MYSRRRKSETLRQQELRIIIIIIPNHVLATTKLQGFKLSWSLRLQTPPRSPDRCMKFN
jgi:hypothetical protein